MAMDVQVHFDIEPRWSVRDIVEHADGTCTVDDVPFTSLERAYAHIHLRNELDLTIERLQELERDVEKVIALREDYRGAARELIDRLVERQDGDPEPLFNELHDDVTTGLAANLRKSERAVQGQLDEAAALRSNFPNTHCAWMDGEIHIGHVRVISKAAQDLDTSALPEYEHLVLPQARCKTPAQLARVANRIARRLASPPTPEAVDEAVQDRAVWLTQQPDGMTHLTIKTTPILAEAAYDRLRQAFGQRDRQDDRGLHQHMSDSAMRLLLTGTAPPADDANTDVGSTAIGAGFMAGVTARVTVTMPATLLTHGRTLDGLPGAELPDGTLIDDGTALLLAAGVTSWTRLFTDPVTGVAITADVYQPTASLRRLIIGRDQTCRFPGCSRPAVRTDLDHTVDWQYGGTTTPQNLAALCRRHHVLKHRDGPHSGWIVQQTKPGELLWLGPRGNLHRVKPEPIPTAISPPDEQGRTRALDPWKPPPEPPDKSGIPF
ncbi:HNH endonuclease signature motif containing protein [uncultured Agrococcus sp.]|uniref:HNH endonuclease signature motif containing protein n=1 Tax=uncultured Agrococcus sp. TaxID=382258 RepID=UPI0025ED46BC|nr:HNH endonuclease signature motif containing protein [uncultured Agrococcus sp.]